MDLEMPNYFIDYSPSNKPKGFGFIVRLPRGFQEAVRTLEIDSRAYESLVRESLKEHEFDEMFVGQGDNFCNWQEGLLHHVTVPGNASSLCLEDGVSGPMYYPHNIDRLDQTSVLLSVITTYLSEVRVRFHLLNSPLD